LVFGLACAGNKLREKSAFRLIRTERYAESEWIFKALSPCPGIPP